MNDGPAFDLVLATIDRTLELTRFLESLVSQTYRKFRLILVDQNEDRRLEPIVDAYRDRLPLVCLTSEPGLSRARNIGLRYLDGNIVSFPDDDCWYPPDLLRRVADTLGRRAEWDAITGRTFAEGSRSPFVLWQKHAGLVTRENVWRTAVAVTIFLRRSTIERVGSFDETLGAGSGTPWGSGEETDYVLRALAAGCTIGYDPALAVFHESPTPAFAKADAAKGYRIGMGNSLVLRKHRYPASFAAYRVLQTVAGSMFFLIRGRPGLTRFYWAMARGRLRGWLTAPRIGP